MQQVIRLLEKLEQTVSHADDCPSRHSGECLCIRSEIVSTLKALRESTPNGNHLPGEYYTAFSMRQDVAILTTQPFPLNEAIPSTAIPGEIVRMRGLSPQRIATMWLFRAAPKLLAALQQIDILVPAKPTQQASIITLRKIRSVLGQALPEATGEGGEGPRPPIARKNILNGGELAKCR
jgi:hypothetical protein